MDGSGLGITMIGTVEKALEHCKDLLFKSKRTQSKKSLSKIKKQKLSKIKKQKSLSKIKKQKSFIKLG